jgi:DNA polymerase I-like protein with 3'-5' exonuclease and polymerase domains
MRWPDLSRYDLAAVDTETDGMGFRNRPVGLSIKTADERKTYIRWGHQGGGNNCSLSEFRRWAKKELNRSGLTLVMHNAPFDMRMLKYVGVDLNHSRVEDTGFVAALLNELEPSLALDELASKHAGIHKNDDELNLWCAEHFGGRPTRRAQAGNYWRAPGTIVAPYAIGDVDMTLALYQMLRPRLSEEDLEDVYEMETSLLPILLRMHMEGVKIDVAYAEKLKKKLEIERDDMQVKWRKLCGGKDVNFRSGDQLTPIFEAAGISTPLTKTGKKSFKKDYLEHVDHPLAQTKLKLAQLDHYINTFIDSYVLDNVDDNGFIHGEFHPLRNDSYGTVSGRFSSGGALNLQNIPARDEVWAPLIRAMYVPRSRDHQWVKADYSQIEFRYLAHYEGGRLMDAYNQQPDIDFHQMVADLTGIPRKPAKNINFGLVYGMGVALMAVKLGLPYNEARELLEEYHSRLPGVRKLYDRADRRAKKRGYIVTWGGRKRRFRRQGRSYQHTHKALNALLQGSAADLLKRAMIAVDQVIDWDEVRLHLTVHDELDFSSPKGDKRWPKLIRETMEDFRLNVPVKADVEIGQNWGHVKEAV